MTDNNFPKLIIVDDQLSNLTGLKIALQDEFKIITVTDGEECIRLLPNFKPDIVMTDYEMEGLNGLQLMEILVRHPVKPKITLFSACLNQNLMDSAIKLGANDCIAKPFDLKSLKEKLQRILRQEHCRPLEKSGNYHLLYNGLGSGRGSDPDLKNYIKKGRLR